MSNTNSRKRTPAAPSAGAAAPETSPWMRIAVIGRPHGVHGELRVWPDNPESTLLFEDIPLRLHHEGKPPRPIAIDAIRDTGDALLVTFTGVVDREGAAALTHGAIEVPRDVLPQLEDGEFYHIDVLGAAVLDADTGVHLGTVKSFTETSVDVLVVDTERGEVLVPILADIVLSIGEEPGIVRVRNLDDWR